MSILLEARSLAYEYNGGTSALCGVDFSLAEGESVALIGANGAGKSTLLQLLVGVLDATRGQVVFRGDVVTKKNLATLRQKVGLIFQNPEHQLFCNSVFEDVCFGPLNMGLSHNEAANRANSALSQLKIEHLAARPPYRLSAGEKRLAAIASVLAMQPQVLLMDEPTAELDPRARRELIVQLATLPQAKIIATHDLDFAEKTCPEAILLHKGKIAVREKTSKLLANTDLLYSNGL